MTAKEALDNIAIISEILVDVSKSHIMPKEAINQIRKLDVAEIYFTLRPEITELDELKCDVKRLIELDYQGKNGDGIDDIDAIEYTRLHIKLSKVGKEDV